MYERLNETATASQMPEFINLRALQFPGEFKTLITQQIDISRHGRNHPWLA